MLSKAEKDEILNDFESFIDELRISNEMWRKNQDEITQDCLNQLEVILTKLQNQRSEELKMPNGKDIPVKFRKKDENVKAQNKHSDKSELEALEEEPYFKK